jgi:hypothetical protein
MMEMPALCEDDAREATAPVLLDLPDAEMGALIKMISPDRVSYGVAVPAKHIATNVQRFGAPGTKPLSPRERNAAIRIAYRYRRQMPTGVIALLSRWPASVFALR